jgi:ubiquinone/menaquinone biosynthesis C-methylase UbiE
MEVNVSEHLTQVADYYNQMNPLILKYVGTSYQSCLLKGDSEEGDAYRATNLYCAAQAGVRSGYHILDAGCGVCGPSIDIARAFEGVRIDGITLSSEQASTARELVKQAQLTSQIQVHVGDFHQLPFENEVFDLVLFLESLGYSYDLLGLFTEVYRVLKPDGILYIKEPFSKEPPFSEQEQQELEAVSKIYFYNLVSMKLTAQLLAEAGFHQVACQDISNIFSMELYNQKMFEYKYGFPFLTEFGKYHFYHFQFIPGFLGEVKARKPA